ncbi:Curved DNA-binding protein (42 kDa protein) [Tulasnella sp. UAMH 9824]|nr:Curved DNA-binding protein (42 kDa protein) [Tulasnella sp. UAMH 9824]
MSTTENPANQVDQDGFKTVQGRRANKPKTEKKPEVNPAEQEADRRRKYKTAATIVHQVLQNLVSAAVEGASIQKLCVDGDEEITKLTGAAYPKAKKEMSKGIAFPTCVSVNNVVSHFSPLPSDELAEATIAKGDVVKIQLGAQIDGYAAVQTETIIVGATKEEPATGRKADVVKAAYIAAQAALRQFKVDEKNWTVTDTIAKVAGQWDCKPVEGMLSCEHTQGAIDGKKRIILNPTPEQRSSHEKASFVAGEVYGVDVLVSSNPDGKCKAAETRTSVYQRVGGINYQLKLKASKSLIESVEAKAGYFPFNLRSLDDITKARVAIQEGERHGVFRPYEVTQTPKDTFVAAYMFTVLVTEQGPALLTEPSGWYSEDKLKTEKQLADDEIKSLLATEVNQVKSAGEVKVTEKKPGAKRIRRPKAAGAAE